MKPCNEAGPIAHFFGYVQHDYKEVARTHLPGRPVQAWELNTIHDIYSIEREGRLQQQYIQRTLHGVTKILMRCARCNREYTSELLGQVKKTDAL